MSCGSVDVRKIEHRWSRWSVLHDVLIVESENVAAVGAGTMPAGIGESHTSTRRAPALDWLLA